MLADIFVGGNWRRWRGPDLQDICTAGIFPSMNMCAFIVIALCVRCCKMINHAVWYLFCFSLAWLGLLEWKLRLWANFVRGAKTVADLVIVVALLCFQISPPSQYHLGIPIHHYNWWRSQTWWLWLHFFEISPPSQSQYAGELGVCDACFLNDAMF